MNRIRESTVNVALRLSALAKEHPDRLAIVEARTGGEQPDSYRQCTFAELDEDSDHIATGLRQQGIKPGMRIVLLVPPGVDFISLFFAMLKSGIVTILIDPGMGREHLLDCLAEAEPEGFIAIPKVHAALMWTRKRFPQAKHNIVVGKSLLFRRRTLTKLRRARGPLAPVMTESDDAAAVIFTSGSTGPPKGVLYTHGNFDRQVEEIRDQYAIQGGDVDLSGFPLFALFNAAMGVTTIIPEMDFTRPADADPPKIVAAMKDWNATQAFGSPALWNTVARYCEEHEIQVPSLTRVLSAGAPVPPHVLRRVSRMIAAEGQVHTPYGATEALPVATISSNEILKETASESEDGAGTCVGTRFPGIEWKVIQIHDEPIERIEDAVELGTGEIGELIVRGPVVTHEYVTQVDANRFHKIKDGDHFWHRMGDVGYLDRQDRFWFCGRKSHRVQLLRKVLYTVPIESVMNQHERVNRSALVGIGPKDHQRPVLIAELWKDQAATTKADKEQVVAELWSLAKSHKVTRDIHDILLHDDLPVDVRHNSKIFREKLAVWADRQLNGSSPVAR